MCLEYLARHQMLIPVKQAGCGSSIYSRRTKTDSTLGFNKSIKDQFNLLRVVNNTEYPAYFIIDGHGYKLQIEKY